VFNTNFNDFSKSEAPQQQQQAPLQNVANSPRIFGDESKNKEIIKTNMNYMSMNASQEKVNYNDGIILNKQTNDIYFKRVSLKENFLAVSMKASVGTLYLIYFKKMFKDKISLITNFLAFNNMSIVFSIICQLYLNKYYGTAFYVQLKISKNDYISR